MKNYFIVLLLVVILVIASFSVKQNRSPIYNGFPVKLVQENGDTRNQETIYLYVFFSRHNCRSCLEFIPVLNHLPPQFRAIGLVPQEELKDKVDIGSVIGADFPIDGENKFRKFIPPHRPAILGVSGEGKILFVLPGVPGLKDYLLSFLTDFYVTVSDSLGHR